MGTFARSSSSPMKAKYVCYILCILVINVGQLVSSDNGICPFDYLFQLGDGVFDIGNGVRMLPLPQGRLLPASCLPYGQTDPGCPTGRYSDGLLNADFGGRAFGFPDLTPYLSGINASENNAIVFSVVRSPVLDRTFFLSEGVELPFYIASLETQISWFKQYLETTCSTPEDCADVLGNSLVLFGDVEANDITYPLLQGKSIEEVADYIPLVTQAQIEAAREAIELGARRILFTGNVPIGCYPFMLTQYLRIHEDAPIDDLGCLIDVNDLVLFKNDDLYNAVNDLIDEFPDVTIIYTDYYYSFLTILQDWNYEDPDAVTMEACCGIGGDYNYDETRFCGSDGVPVCPDPNQYIHWDGIHLTNEANIRLSDIILHQGALELFDCTPPELFNTSQLAQNITTFHNDQIKTSS